MILDYGNSCSMDWKAFVYHDNAVHFELRRVLLDFYNGKMKKVEVHKYLKRYAHFIDSVVSVLDLTYNSAVIQNRNALRRQGGNATDDYVREEYSVSVDFLIGLLAKMGREMWSNEDKTQALGLLELFMCSCCGVCEWSVDTCTSLCDRHGAQCACLRAPGAKYCMLLQGIIASFTASHQFNIWKRIACLLADLQPATSQCVSTKSVYKAIVDTLASAMRLKLSTLPFRIDPPGARAETAGNRTRIDEDYKHKVIESLPKQSRVHGGSQYLRATGDADERSARTWEYNYLREYFTAMRFTWKMTQVFHTTQDAARNGNPAEDTSLYFGYEPHTDTGGVMIPQANGFTD
jgi:hypothetical protein